MSKGALAVVKIVVVKLKWSSGLSRWAFWCAWLYIYTIGVLNEMFTGTFLGLLLYLWRLAEEPRQKQSPNAGNS